MNTLNIYRLKYCIVLYIIVKIQIYKHKYIKNIQIYKKIYKYNKMIKYRENKIHFPEKDLYLFT
jgi:hypothetical protein